MIRNYYSIPFFMLALSSHIAEGAVADLDLARAKSFYVVLGQAKACEFSYLIPMIKVSAWFESVVPFGSAESRSYDSEFTSLFAKSYEDQRKDLTPQACDKTRNTFSSTHWPEGVLSASDETLEQALAYMTLLGRANACGINYLMPMGKTNGWIATFVPRGSPTEHQFMPVLFLFFSGSSRTQSRSAEACALVQQEFDQAKWP